jgi:hypothetical protein
MPERLEYTIGVCVSMKWDARTESYVPDGPMTTTVGGLFSDAEEGAWDPAKGDWVSNETDAMLAAHQRAERLVSSYLGLEVQ